MIRTALLAIVMAVYAAGVVGAMWAASQLMAAI